MASPIAAATATLSDLLPFAVCNEVTPMEEPTGVSEGEGRGRQR